MNVVTTATEELYARAGYIADSLFAPERDLPTNVRQLKASWNHLQGKHTGLEGYAAFYIALGAHVDQADILARATLNVPSKFYSTPNLTH